MPKNQITSTTTSEITVSTPIAQLLNTYLDSVKTSKGTPPSEADKINFVTFCLSNNLNPIKKQAYLMGYDTKNGPSFSTIVSISGYTAIAMQTGLCAGIDQPRFNYNGNILDSCSITVYRLVKGEKCGFTGTAYYSERVGKKYDGSLTEPWAKQPKTMLEKCAKAAALRNAFPDQLSGVYTEDEMPKADVEIEAKKPEPEIEYISPEQLQKLLKHVLPLRAEQSNCTVPKLVGYLCGQLKVEGGLNGLTMKQAQGLITLLEKTNKEFVPTVPPATVEDMNIQDQPVNEVKGVENSFVEVEATDAPPTKSERQTTIEECTSLEILQSLEAGITTEEEKLAFDLKYQEFNQ
jgi:phage recombination protein Bet